MITKKKYQRGGAGAYKHQPKPKWTKIAHGQYKNSSDKIAPYVSASAAKIAAPNLSVKNQQNVDAQKQRGLPIIVSGVFNPKNKPPDTIPGKTKNWTQNNYGNWLKYGKPPIQPTPTQPTQPTSTLQIPTQNKKTTHVTPSYSMLTAATLRERGIIAKFTNTKKNNKTPFKYTVNMPERVWLTEAGVRPKASGLFNPGGNTPKQPLARAALNRQMREAETLPERDYNKKQQDPTQQKPTGPTTQQKPTGPTTQQKPTGPNTPPPKSNLLKTPAGPEPPKPPAGPEPPKTPPTPAEIKQNISYYFFNIHNINYNNPDPKPLQDLSAKMLDTFKDLMILQNKTNQETTNKLLAIIEKQAAGLNLIPQTQSQSQSLPQTQQEEKEKKKKIRGFFDRLYYHIKILFRNEKAALKEFHKKTLKREKAVKDTHRYTRNMKRHRKRTKKATKDAQRAEYFSLASKQYEADRQAAANAATKAAKKAASSNTKASRDAAKAAVKKTKKAINNAASKLMSKTKKAKKAKLILNSLRNKLTGQTNDKQYFDYKLKEIEYELSITPISNKNKRKDLQKKLNYYKNTLTKNIFPISNDNQVNQNFFNP